MTVKSFYIRRTPDMTDAQVAEVLDKAVTCGAKLGNGVRGFHQKNPHTPNKWKYFGVMDCGYTCFGNYKSAYGSDATEITIDQVDEWLGIEPKEPTVAERMEALIEQHMDKIPDWARWVAVDADGECCVFSAKPYLYSDVFTAFDCRCDKILHLVSSSPLVINWRETLTELKPDAITQYYEDRRGAVGRNSKPDANDEMVARDEQTPPHPVNAYWQAKQDAKQFIAGMPAKQLTIPSTCLAEPTSHMMMLGGEFGGDL